MVRMRMVAAAGRQARLRAGIARQRQAIVHGLRESVKDFNDGVSEITSRECAPA